MARQALPHALMRGGPRYPIPMSKSKQQKSIGWLTHLEYDVLDMHLNRGVCNIYFFIKETGPRHRRRGPAACERLFNELESMGLVTGPKTDFKATNAGLFLYEMTDNFILEEVRKDDAEKWGTK